MNDNLVLSNMLHRPARTLVSVVGIGVGVLLIIFTTGLARGTLRENAQREANVGAEIMVRASGTMALSGTDPFRLPVSRADELRRIEGVQTAIPIGQNLAQAKDANFGSRLIEGIQFDEYANLAGLKIIDGRAVNANGNEAVIDTAWAESRKLKVGDKLSIYEKDFTIVGTYEPAAGGGRIKIPLATMQEQLGGEGKSTAILVKVASGADVNAVGERIVQNFPDDQILLTKDLEGIWLSAIPALNVFLNVVIGVSAVISALVILLTMYTTVTERTRQIGVLKSLGMSKTQIAWTITQEALLLSFLGVLTGILLTFVARFVVMRTTTMRIEIEWKWILITLVVGLLGGAAGALYPAIRAARLDAVEALSYE
jgi:putative ABC transport system permease protein